MKHFLTVDDFGKDGILRVLELAESYAARHRGECLVDAVVGLLFFQESTRTRFGFSSATARLGGSTCLLDRCERQSQMGFEESLADTVRSVSAYCDCIVMRHSCTGDAMDAVRASVAPVVSGGFGVDHHPTQALIDLYAIKKSLGRLERIRIGVVGRLKYSRSAKSLVQALSFFNSAEVRQMAPEGEALLCLPEASTPCTAVTAIDASGLDVLYAAGLPKKNHVMSEMNSEDRERLTITSSVVAALPRHAIVLCPLPRLDEISPDVDDMPCARYFKQSDDGIFVRMAVLDYVTSVNRSVGVTP